MINDFISDLKKSPYYKKFILNDDILCLYVGGSTSAGTRDGNSDFDLIAITLSGECFDASDEVYLKYRGKKVHWYYWPVKEVFELGDDCVWLAGSIYFRNINSNLIIYLKPGYQDLWDTLTRYSASISQLACYQFFYTHEKMISKVLEAKDLLAVPPHKGMYHLCLATSYLLNEEVDLDLLRDLKTICRQDLKPTSNKPALEIISKGLNYVKEFPINVNTELKNLYEDFCKKVKMLNFSEVEL